MIRKVIKMEEKILKRLLSIWLASNIEAHAFIPKEYWYRQLAFVQLVLPNSDIYVFSRNDEVLGFVGLNQDYIEGLFVDERHRNCGIGKQLIDYLKRQNNQLSLAVFKRNKAALRFYHNAGFTAIKEQTEEQTNEIELIMSWQSLKK